MDYLENTAYISENIFSLLEELDAMLIEEENWGVFFETDYLDEVPISEYAGEEEGYDDIDLWPSRLAYGEELKRSSREVYREKIAPTAAWLAKEMDTGHDLIFEALDILEQHKGYRISFRRKRGGGKRQILEPQGVLKRIQKGINRDLLISIPVSKNAFGFSGGGVRDAILPHLGSKSILCVDFKNAFPSVTREMVFKCLNMDKHRNTGTKKGRFSWYAAKVITELATFQGKLPQGASTSPRLFDLVCGKIDKDLSRLAKNVGGKYTRYADNIYFSMNQEEFPRKIRQAILKVIEGKRGFVKFGWHKLRIKTLSGDAIRMLGLNLMDGKIHNTRAFKRRLRLAIHHVQWLLDNKQNCGEAWVALHGQMTFAQKDTLPKSLLEAYERLLETAKKRIMI